MSNMGSYIGAQPTGGLLHLTFHLCDISFPKIRETWISILLKWPLDSNNSHKSEHETLQLHLNDKPTNLRVQAREEVLHSSDKSNFDE